MREAIRALPHHGVIQRDADGTGRSAVIETPAHMEKHSAGTVSSVNAATIADSSAGWRTVRIDPWPARVDEPECRRSSASEVRTSELDYRRRGAESSRRQTQQGQRMRAPTGHLGLEQRAPVVSHLSPNP